MLKGITVKKFKELIEAHHLWLEDNNQGERLNLSERILNSPAIRKLLKNCNLSKANLAYADLRGVDLSKVNLSFANLRGANLGAVNLSNANLAYAKLNNANLRCSSLEGANLKCADLSFSSLHYAILRGAQLRFSDFYHTDLSEVNLSKVDLTDVKNFYVRSLCPSEGSFIGWKKVRMNWSEYIIKLEIPADAKRSSDTYNHCRCSKAKVLEIQNLNGTIAKVTEVAPLLDTYVYKVGEVIYAKSFAENRFEYDFDSITFFIDKQEIYKYSL